MKTFGIGRKPLEITIHIISWFLIFSFPIMLTEWGDSIDWEQCLRDGFVPLCSFLIFYINYLYLVPCCLFKNKTHKFLLLNLILIVGMAMVLHFGHMLMFSTPSRVFTPEFHPPHHHRWVFLGRHLVMMAFVAGLSTAIRLSLRWHHMEERLVEAEREKTEAELKNLKNQLNPHFLLNTLNNIYALIVFDGTKAQDAVQELSRLLRYVLYDNQSAKVPLEKELGFIRDYISLMRIRLSSSMEISVNLDAGEKPIYIVPLIFISLIENAFKHGISPTETSFIRISIQGNADESVRCEIVNSNHPKSLADKSGSGIGLAQVRRRLELSYPHQYEWTEGTSDDSKVYTSTLIIQTKES